MKLAFGFLAALTLTQAAMGVNSMKLHQLDHPFSKLPRPVDRGSLRISEGQEVAPHSLPYQVFLRLILDFGETFCGGSIVSPTTVLTAAHCLDNIKQVVAYFGLHDIRTKTGTQLQVDQVIIHPSYNSEGIENDIAILRFDKQIELNEHVQIVRLPSRAEISKDFAGEMAKASGWGYNNLGFSPVLLSVDVAVMSNNECNSSWGGIVTPSLICINSAGGRSTCMADSGGPLVANGKLIGIISFGSYAACGSAEPSILTRVTAFLDWIAQNSDVVIG